MFGLRLRVVSDELWTPAVAIDFVSFAVWVLNERLDSKSMEIKWYKYIKVDP